MAGRKPVLLPRHPQPGTEQRLAQLNWEPLDFPAAWHCHVWCRSFVPSSGAGAWGQKEAGA